MKTEKYIAAHKPEFLNRLRSTQMNAAGFFAQVSATPLNELWIGHGLPSLFRPPP